MMVTKQGRVVAIDPGTKCGIAWADNGVISPFNVTVIDLANKHHEGAGMRFVKFEDKLRTFAPERVYYELVARHIGTRAAHVYGGLVAVLQAFCERNDIPYSAVPVGTIKKHATGKGNASKQMMIEAAQTRLGYEREDDNEADAMWLLHCAMSEAGLLLDFME